MQPQVMHCRQVQQFAPTAQALAGLLTASGALSVGSLCCCCSTTSSEFTVCVSGR